MLLVHWARRAASRAACTAGNSRAIRTAMMAITTSSSISVKPRRNFMKHLHRNKTEKWQEDRQPHTRGPGAHRTHECPSLGTAPGGMFRGRSHGDVARMAPGVSDSGTPLGGAGIAALPISSPHDV